MLLVHSVEVRAKCALLLLQVVERVFGIRSSLFSKFRSRWTEDLGTWIREPRQHPDKSRMVENRSIEQRYPWGPNNTGGEYRIVDVVVKGNPVSVGTVTQDPKRNKFPFGDTSLCRYVHRDGTTITKTPKTPKIRDCSTVFCKRTIVRTQINIYVWTRTHLHEFLKFGFRCYYSWPKYGKLLVELSKNFSICVW